MGIMTLYLWLDSETHVTFPNSPYFGILLMSSTSSARALCMS